MDEPARKRRRTASPSALQRSSSPLKQPPRRLSRPSFASPTKASLARFNPNLLPPRRSTEPNPASKQSRGDIVNRGKQARTFIFGDAPSDGLSEYIARYEEQEEEGDEATAGAQQQSSFKGQSNISRRRVRNSSIRESLAPPGLGEEEELPTDTSPGAMQPDASRRGMLFSSPSKRPPRMLKDPSKPLPPTAGQTERQKRRSVSATSGAEDGEQAEKEPERKKERLDPELEAKKRKKEALLRELRDLEGHVAECTKTIHKLQDPATPQILSIFERDNLISFINKLTSSDGGIPEDKPPPISNLLCSFLPFTAHAVAGPKAQAEQEETIPSHRPVELDDPLPYLSMFTSFKFTSRLSLPDAKTLPPASEQVNQIHTIDITGPQKLFAATIEATLDTLKHQVVDLKTPRLSHWAEPELIAFLNRKAEEKGLSCVCWAMDSYWQLAKKRAEYWYKCETAFSHLIPGRTAEDSENLDLRKGKERRNGDGKPTMSRKDMLRYLGRDIFVLQDKHVLLKLCWRIGFDWTDEAESTVSVETAFPSVWSEADSTESLKKIPQTFDSLLESRGVFEATRILVALLFSSE